MVQHQFRLSLKLDDGRCSGIVRAAKRIRQADDGGDGQRPYGTPVQRWKNAWVCEYHAKNAAQMLADEVVVTEAKSSVVAFQPLGLVLAVMPWNFPVLAGIPIRCTGARGRGTVVSLKHASNVPGCSAAIEELFESVGFPKGLFTNLHINSKHVAGIIRHPLVKAGTLTGSEPAGRSVAKVAGECLKKTVLELGGSDLYSVLADADLGTRC
ncbi:MAG: aldehyde dehydrogenase family protein [Saprospiraceae bacterium]|nr:aldehyde dehydrogenase family protein [Saprospiraceae bacterium]